MPSFLYSATIAALLLFSPQIIGLAEEPTSQAPNQGLIAADKLYQEGNFAKAETSYQALLKTDPRLVPAQVGLIRAMLREQKIDEAIDAANAALSMQPNSASLLAAKGDVQFRRAEIADAELSYIAAKKLDPREVRAYLGLAQVYRSYSLYRKAYDQLQSAHEIAPDNLEVQRVWLWTLPRKERMAALKAYLAGPHPDGEGETKVLAEYFEFLKATADKPAHQCRLVSKVVQTETKLETEFADVQHIRGIGLWVKLNGRDFRLQLDTGAGGIIVSHKVAKKAGLTDISPEHFGGIGNQGSQSGYIAVAEHIRIGELEFQDCVVSVSDKSSVVEEDGLIGADVFGAYVVDIDLPGRQLKLSPLPKRPEDTDAQTTLNSEGEEQTHAEQKEGRFDEPTSNEPKPAVAEWNSEQHVPKDRYVAHEMADWTKVFRFGHIILVPTSVTDSKPMLFGLDTGAFGNSLSVRAGREVSKVLADSRINVYGMNGSVGRVYRSGTATLIFGHLRQPNRDMLTFDLSSLCRYTGTEVSGLLGFSVLRFLEVKLDYRDGLVDFEYDPKHLVH